MHWLLICRHCANTNALDIKKSKKAVGNDGIPSEAYKFASERLLTIMSIFLSGCMLTGKLPSTLMHVVIIPLLKCKSKDPADVNN